MKHHTFMPIAAHALAFIGMLLPASCSTDDILSEKMEPGTTLTLHVTAEGYTDTRAVESGYTTTFDAGDRIGVSIVAGGALKADNVPFTYDGTNWTSSTPMKYYAGATYFASYPYDAAHGGKLSESALIAAFTPAADQSTLALYQANDLMTATGSVSGNTLTFSLAHRMALIEMEIPYQSYTLGTTGSKYLPSEMPELQAGGTGGIKPCFMSNLPAGTTPAAGTSRSDLYRCLVRPQTTAVSVEGIYRTFDEATLLFTQANVALAAGGYNRLKVTNADADTPATTVNYILVYDENSLKAAVASTEKGKYYKLVQNIDLQGANMTTTSSFGSTFDGQGYTISNFTTDDGLFHEITSSGKLVNLTIGGSVTGPSAVGCFASTNRGSIEQCTFIGTVNAKKATGICRSNYGTIQFCSNRGTVTSSEDLASGICYLNYSTVQFCSNSGTVKGDAEAGGICYENQGIVQSCINSGTVTATKVGGICMWSNNTIQSCINSGTVTADKDVGGICYGNNKNMLACYNIGHVIGSGVPDALVHVCAGNAATNVTDCYYSVGSSAYGTKFSATAWPTASLPGWGLYDGTTGYWKTLGGWNDGAPEFPKLWWEK
ncbi:MAG: fimbrillin family protein [Prevotellaceae bacterium]|jgi:hypothetical protein|nr:fimbrillin family protein [Prevotellaceae bacterium]